MARNLELKARMRSVTQGEAYARTSGAQFREVLHHRDTYFHVPRGRLKLREFGGKTTELIYYTRRETSSERWSTYIRIPVRWPGKVRRVLGRLLGVLAVVEKERRLWMYQNARVHIDLVAGLGSFVEFEVVGSAADESYRILRELREKFRIADGDVVLCSYSDLFLREKNLE